MAIFSSQFSVVSKSKKECEASPLAKVASVGGVGKEGGESGCGVVT